MRYVNEGQLPGILCGNLDANASRDAIGKDIFSFERSLMARVNADRCDRRLRGESRVLKSRESLDNSTRQNATIAGTAAITSIRSNFGANDDRIRASRIAAIVAEIVPSPSSSSLGRSLLC